MGWDGCQQPERELEEADDFERLASLYTRTVSRIRSLSADREENQNPPRGIGSFGDSLSIG